MPCYHKFYEDLRLERIDFKPTTLIVGTFNPAWPEENGADWFYGRVPEQAGNPNKGNHFWSVLPQLYGEPILKYQRPGPGVLRRASDASSYTFDTIRLCALSTRVV